MKIWNYTKAIYYSLPVQLLSVQIRYHKLELLAWAFLFLAITNNFGEALGVPYLFLEPEYLGETGFYSMFLLGIGLGTFTAAYSISCYISDSYRFYFIALEYRPFFLFFFNNLIIPTTFLIVYTVCFINFRIWTGGEFTWDILSDVSGLYLGMVMVVIFIFVYFFNVNKNFVHSLGEKVVKDLKGGRVILDRARNAMGIRIRVDSYVSGFFKTKNVDLNVRPDFRALVRTLNQNHGNALFLELILMGAIMLFGLMEDRPTFQFPAGMSIFLFLSVALMLVSAFTFWFRKLGPFIWVFLLAFYWVGSQFEFQKNPHPAFGMNYEIAPATYSNAELEKFATRENIIRDIRNTEMILNRWKSDHHLYHGPYSKPKAVIICTSGGGLRSAYFSVRSMQRLDSLTNGQLMKSTRLFAGASGGMIGSAYFRELSWQRELGTIDSIYKEKYARRISRDMLNRISGKIITDVFLPSMKTYVGGSRYVADRGWSFDQQLVTNLEGVFENRRLADYISLEELAVVPMMILSPVILNDGRKLYISATPTSYMTRNLDVNGQVQEATTGVDFRQFFKKHDADSLLFVTAMRMNASFPLITPYVSMPSQPPMQLVDAGVADNYGLETAYRFVAQFSDWFNQNTSGVMLLQIRDSRPMSMEMPDYHRGSAFGKALDPIGGTYGAFYMSSDLENEHYIHEMDRLLKGELEYVRMLYEPMDSSGTRASLSWHLTRREVDGIEASLGNPLNVGGMERVKNWLLED